MNKMKVLSRAAVAVVMMVVAALPASAQFKIGPRIGLEVNSLHFNDKLFAGDNQAGFTGGVEAEFTVPVVGIGFDASVMYVRRNASFMSKYEGKETTTSVPRDYISVPVNLKYKFGLPIIKPYLFTGPEFAFLTSSRAINDALSSRKTDVSWNVGAGIELINHLQVSASYGFGISKAAEWTGVTQGSAKIDGKNRYWTVTAAWLF